METTGLDIVHPRASLPSMQDLRLRTYTAQASHVSYWTDDGTARGKIWHQFSGIKCSRAHVAQVVSDRLAS